jgi:hypothetical protein
MRLFPNPGIIPEFSCKTTDTLKMASVSARFRTEHIPNRSLERYRYAGPFGKELHYSVHLKTIAMIAQ